MILERSSSTYPASRKSKRYTQVFDYMFILSLNSPKTVTLLCDKKNIWHGTTNFGQKTDRDKDDNLVKKKKFKPIPEFSPRTNIWKYVNSNGFMAETMIAHQHPAIFPLKVAEDLIATYSAKGDIVYDCFSGSGTTLVAAKASDRKFIGSEIVKEYCEIIKNRL